MSLGLAMGAAALAPGQQTRAPLPACRQLEKTLFFWRIRAIRLGVTVYVCRGYNIGIRIVDEFCAKNKGTKCRTFKETMETVGKARKPCITPPIRSLSVTTSHSFQYPPVMHSQPLAGGL